MLVFGLVVEGLSFRTAVKQANEVRGRSRWTTFIRNARAPELPVVILEDAGALTGLLIALGAITAADVTGVEEWDGIGTLAIGILLGIIAIVLVVEMKSLLIGESATRKDTEAIRAAIDIDPAVRRLIYMRTQHIGPEELLVGAKVELDHTLTFPEVAEVVNRIERNVRANVPIARIMYIEPDVTDERRAAPTIDEHEPGHDVPPEVRARLDAEARRGGLGEGIPVEPDRDADGPDHRPLTGGGNTRQGCSGFTEDTHATHGGHTMAVRLGDEAPDFTAETTEGTLSFHEWKGDSWAVLFSHPKDFTPVCTTELGRVAGLKPEFDKRNTKVIGLSVDELDNHTGWSQDIEDVTGNTMNFPMIADTDRKVSDLYDMIHPNADDTLTVRSVFVIGPDNKVKLTLTYPASTGRNFDELLRVIDSLQLTADHKVATPADWTDGDDVIIVPALSDEEAKERFPDGWDAKKPYLRLTKQPQ